MTKTPEQWLAEVDATKRPAVFKLFLGYAPGVGKTYAMLSEGVRRASRGEEVVIGVVETHGRKPIVELSSRLETVPRKKLEYKSTIFEEMDVDAILARKPPVVPLVGNSKRKWLEENAKAAELRPSEATLAALDKTFKPGATQGERYAAPMMARLGL